MSSSLVVEEKSKSKSKITTNPISLVTLAPLSVVDNEKDLSLPAIFIRKFASSSPPTISNLKKGPTRTTMSFINNFMEDAFLKNQQTTIKGENWKRSVVGKEISFAKVVKVEEGNDFQTDKDVFP